MASDGLHGKYRVEKDGESVDECFVLEPGNDEAAREALQTYAEETDNKQLAVDLIDWLDTLEHEEAGHDA